MIMMLIWGLCSSCISEDHSDCYNRYWLELSYVGDGTEEIFQEKIDKVHMYIFDQNSTCVYEKELSEQEVRSQSTLLPKMVEGKYTIVCLGNPYKTGVHGLSTGDWQDVLFSGNDPNYLTSVEYVIEPYSMKKQESSSTAVFACSHYDISVIIEGAPVSDKLPSVVISGTASHTDFTNKVCGEPIDYKMEVAREEEYLVSSCNIFRHLNHQDVNLKVLAEDGSELAVVNFQDFISRHGIDCTKQEVHIPFKVTFKSADVEITLPGWEDTPVLPDFN